MELASQDAYLESQIRTATPQKLRLMLIDGALRFAREAQAHWSVPLEGLAMAALGRCRSILAELLGSIDADASPLARRVADLYLYLYQTRGKVQTEADAEGLAAVIRVLEEERITWEELCRKLPETPLEPREVEEITCRTLSEDPTSLPDTGSSLELDA